MTKTGAHLARRLALAAAALALLGAQPALAQLADTLGSVAKSAGGALGGAGLPQVDQASPSNLAGVLQYCVKNNYLGGDAKSMGGSVLGKLTGSGQTKDKSAFDAGSGGLLQTGGDGFSLGGGMKEKVTEQVCDMVLKHAQSLL